MTRDLSRVISQEEREGMYSWHVLRVSRVHAKREKGVMSMVQCYHAHHHERWCGAVCVHVLSAPCCLLRDCVCCVVIVWRSVTVYVVSVRE